MDILSKIMCRYFNFVTVILLVVNYHCILTVGSLDTFGQKADIELQRLHTNSTNQHESENGEIFNSDDIIKRISKRQEENSDPLTEHLARCSTNQPYSIGYFYYMFTPQRLQYMRVPVTIFSAGYAYLLAIKYKVLQKNPRYFDLTQFLYSDLNIHFPPILPIVCYDTAYSMHGTAFMEYGRADILQILKNRNTATLQSTSAYMIQRQKMYGELGTLVSDMRIEQKEALKTKCSEANYTKITDLISTLLGDNAIQVMSPTYSLAQYNQVAQIFIGDILAYEMIRQACVAMGSTGIPEITIYNDPNYLGPIRNKLREGVIAVRRNWHAMQLQKDVEQNRGQLQLLRPLDENNLATFIQTYSNELMVKYYEYGFRVTIHSKWTAAEAKIICSGAQNVKCFDIPNAMVLVRWKSLKPAELAASYEALQQYIKFPKVPHPAQPYGLSDLYARMHADLTKLQNAVNYLRDTHLQNRFYKQVIRLFHAFDSGTPPDIYAETADGLAKSLDALNVFIKEFYPLIEMFSAVAMHTGVTGVDKVWALIDRSFHEMNFYMADIEEHITQLRQQVVDKSRPFTFYNVVRGVLLDNDSEEVRKIRKASGRYPTDTPFYVKEDGEHRTLETLTNFTDSCDFVKCAIDNIRNSLISYATTITSDRMGSLGPFYFHIFYSVASYDLAYLTMYSLFCINQRYKWISARNREEPDTTLSRGDIQQFLNITQKDMMDVSDALNESTEAISKHAYKSQFYWAQNIPSALEEEDRRLIPESDAGAQGVADKLNRLFPWVSFSVVLTRGNWKGFTLLDTREKMYYYKFFVNPDYSLFIARSAGTPNIIVNWAPKKRSSEMQTNAERFGISVGSAELCTVATSSIIQFLKGYRNIKSFFVWRSFVGYGRHSRGHVGNHYGDERTNLVDEPSTFRSGTTYGTIMDASVCWFRHSVGAGTWDHACEGYGVYNCHRDDKLVIHALGNVGEDY